MVPAPAPDFCFSAHFNFDALTVTSRFWISSVGVETNRMSKDHLDDAVWVSSEKLVPFVARPGDSLSASGSTDTLKPQKVLPCYTRLQTGPFVYSTPSEVQLNQFQCSSVGETSLDSRHELKPDTVQRSVWC